MANLYVSSVAGSNTAPYDTWAKAAILLSTAAAAAAAGDDIWVASDHAETTAAAITPTFPGTLASPNRVISVNRAGSTPPVAADILAGASVTTTGAASHITLAGSHYRYGITFSAGNGTSTASSITGTSANHFAVGDNCIYKTANTNNGGLIQLPGTSSAASGVEINPQFRFASTGGRVSPGGRFAIKGGSYVSGTAAVTLFSLFNTAAVGVVDGFDFTNCAAALNLITGGSTSVADISFRNCKPPANWSGGLFSSAPGTPAFLASMYNCDNANTNYKLWPDGYVGSVRDETTIVRTSGATDGTTPFAWKMVSGANAKFWMPLRSPDIFLWNDTTGASKTLTVEIAHSGVGAGAAGAFQNDEIWIEVQALTTSGFPLSTTTSNAKANVLAAAADQATSTSPWTSSPATPVYQKLAVTFTPQVKGNYVATVCLAKASKTVYVDPFVTLT